MIGVRRDLARFLRSIDPGAEDRVLPLAQGRRLAAVLPNAEFRGAEEPEIKWASQPEGRDRARRAC
jgi:hypothetical protein